MIDPAAKIIVSPREVVKYLAKVTLVFVAYYLAGRLGQALLSPDPGRIGAILPASGIGLAALLFFGDQVWPGVLAGAFFLALLIPISPAAALFHGIGATLAALTGSFLLRGVVNFNPSMSRFRDAFGLIALGAFGSSVVSASIGTSVLYVVHVIGWSGFGKAWIINWLGGSIGVLLLTPLVLSLLILRKSPLRARTPELVALLLFLAASCFIIIGDVPTITVRLHFLAFAALPFVVWAAMRFGVRGATLSTFTIAAIASVETALGSGPFAENTPFVSALSLDILFVVLSTSGLMLAAILAEREQAQQAREQSVRTQATMQARFRLAAIVESSDDAIIGKDLDGIITDWNKGAERIYGYSAEEMVGKSISLLAPTDRAGDVAEILSKIKQGERISHFATTRRTRDGGRIDVSLTVSPVFDANGRIVGASAIARDISAQKHQEAVLRESEERFRLVADNAPAMIWMSDADNRSIFVNKAWLDFTGRSWEAELTGNWAEGIHTEDLDRSVDIYAKASYRREPFRMEYRLRRHDGEYRWILDIGVPRFNQDGSYAGFVGTGVDITESKLAGEVLASVSRRLIEAQERERTRIAREIHDDIGQRLALLSVEIHQMSEIIPNSVIELRSRMDALADRTREISIDAQSLSHELHSSRLEYLGIVSAMRGFCNEFCDKHKVEVDFESQGVPLTVPSEISVCVFRVLQESLNNAWKHSGVRRFEVNVQGSLKEIQLIVRDSGVGFDPELTTNTRGLGLISMRERVNLVKGTISITSRPMSGTVVSVCVPLPAAAPADQAKAAGA
jgi:PAS domain S-box-containing protein